MTDKRRDDYYSEEDFERDLGLTHYDRAEEMGLYDDFQSAGRRSRKNRKKEKSRSRSRKSSAKTSHKKPVKKGSKGSGRKRSKGRTALIILLAIAVLLLSGYLIAKGYIKSKLDKADRIKVSQEEWGIDPKVGEDLKGYKNIVILGIDARESEGITTEQSRTDAIILVTINKKTKEVQLTSIMRDTGMDCEEQGGHKLDKITHQHFWEGPVATVRALNRNLDLNIDDFIRVDWAAVSNVVDSMGGLEIDVPENQIDELNLYIAESAYAVGQEPVYFSQPGLQTLNGPQAVTYCRVRHVDGDEMRGGRMREVIQAAIQKAKKMSLPGLNRTIDIGMKDITTSMSTDTMMDMIMDLTSYDVKESKGYPYEYDGAMIGGLSYVIPVTHLSNVVKLHEQLFGQTDYTPTDTVKVINEEIKNQSGKYGDEQADYTLLQQYRILFPAPDGSY